MSTLALPTLVTPDRLASEDTRLLRLQVAELQSRQDVAAIAYHRLRGETEQLRTKHTAALLEHAAERRRMDLLVAICQRARCPSEGVSINDGDTLLVNPTDLRAALDVLLASGVTNLNPA